MIVADAPNFWKILLKQLWLMVKILVPLCAWLAFIIWVCYPHPILMSLSMSGSILLGMVVWTAWSTYKWERQDWIRELRARERDERKYNG